MPSVEKDPGSTRSTRIPKGETSTERVSLRAIQRQQVGVIVICRKTVEKIDSQRTAAFEAA